MKKNRKATWPLPYRQFKVFDFIVNFIEEGGFSPLEVEIARALKMTRSNVQDTLVRLMAKGKIKRRPKHGHRNIKVIHS